MERACRMDSNQKDGYLPTGRAGDTTMEKWIHKKNKLRHNTQTYKTREEEQNKHNKIRQKEIKVRMNDVLVPTYFWHKISMAERIQ